MKSFALASAVSALVILSLVAGSARSQEWTSPTNGLWNTPTRWSPMTVPDTPGASAVLTTGTYTISTGAPMEFTVGGLTLTGGTVTLDGFGLLFDKSATPATLAITSAGTLGIASGIRLTGDLDMTLADLESTLTLGSVEAAAGGSRISRDGFGSVQLANGFSGGNVTLALGITSPEGPPEPVLAASGGNASWSGNLLVETGAAIVSDAAFFGNTVGATTLGVTGMTDPLERLGAVYLTQSVGTVAEDFTLVNGAVLKLDSPGTSTLSGNVHVGAGAGDARIMGSLWFGLLSEDPPNPGDLVLDGTISGSGDLVFLTNQGARVVFDADASVMGNEFTGNLLVGSPGLEVNETPGDRNRLVLAADGGFGTGGLVIYDRGTVLIDGPGNGSAVDRFDPASTTIFAGGEMLLQNNSVTAGSIGLFEGVSRIDFAGDPMTNVALAFAGGLSGAGWSSDGTLRVDGFTAGDSLVISGVNGFLTPEQASRVGFKTGGFYVMGTQDVNPLSPTAGALSAMTSNDFTFDTAASGSWTDPSKWTHPDPAASGLVPNNPFARATVSTGAQASVAMEVTGSGIFSVNQLFLEASDATSSVSLASGIDIQLSPNGTREALLEFQGSGSGIVGGNVRLSDDIRIATSGSGSLTMTGVEQTAGVFTSIVSSGHIEFGDDGPIPGSAPLVTFDASGGDIVINGGLSGEMDIAKTGAGTVTLAGQTSFDWSTSQNAEVFEGTLRSRGPNFTPGITLRSGTVFEAAPLVNQANPGGIVGVGQADTVSVIDAIGGGAEFRGVAPGGHAFVGLNGLVRLAGGELLLHTDENVTVWMNNPSASGATIAQDTLLPGDASVRKTGAGIVSIGGINSTLTGMVTVNDGTLTMLSAGALGSGPGAAGTLVHGINGGELFTFHPGQPGVPVGPRATLAIQIFEDGFVGTHEVLETIELDTGTLWFSGFSGQDVTLRGDVNVTGPAFVVVDTGNQPRTFTIDSLSGSGPLTVRGFGADAAVTLSSSNSYSGGLTIDGATVMLRDPAALGPAGSVTVGQADDIFLFSQPTLAFNTLADGTFSRDISLIPRGTLRNEGPGIVTLGGDISLGGGTSEFFEQPRVAGAGAFRVTNPNQLVNGTGFRAGSFTKSGTGMLSIEASQSFGAFFTSDPTVGSVVHVDQGILRLAANGALGQTGDIQVASGGAVLLSGVATDRMASATNVTLAGGMLAFDVATTEALGTVRTVSTGSLEQSTINFGGVASELTIDSLLVDFGATLVLENHVPDSSRLFATTTSAGDVARTLFAGPGGTLRPAMRDGSNEIRPLAGHVFSFVSTAATTDWFAASAWEVGPQINGVPDSIIAEARIGSSLTGNAAITSSRFGEVFINRLVFENDSGHDVTLSQSDQFFALVLTRPVGEPGLPSIVAGSGSTGTILVEPGVEFEMDGILQNDKPTGTLEFSGAVAIQPSSTLRVTGTGTTIFSGGLGGVFPGAGVRIETIDNGRLVMRSGGSVNASFEVAAGRLGFENGPDFSGLTGVHLGASAVWDVTDFVSPFLVGAGNTLSGTGTVQGLLAIGGGGRIAPGNSPGTLTHQGNLTLAGGGRVCVGSSRLRRCSRGGLRHHRGGAAHGHEWRHSPHGYSGKPILDRDYHARCLRPARRGRGLLDQRPDGLGALLV